MIELMNELMHAYIPKSWVWLQGNVGTDQMYALMQCKSL